MNKLKKIYHDAKIIWKGKSSEFILFITLSSFLGILEAWSVFSISGLLDSGFRYGLINKEGVLIGVLLAVISTIGSTYLTSFIAARTISRLPRILLEEISLGDVENFASRKPILLKTIYYDTERVVLWCVIPAFQIYGRLVFILAIGALLFDDFNRITLPPGFWYLVILFLALVVSVKISSMWGGKIIILNDRRFKLYRSLLDVLVRLTLANRWRNTLSLLDRDEKDSFRGFNKAYFWSQAPRLVIEVSVFLILGFILMLNDSENLLNTIISSSPIILRLVPNVQRIVVALGQFSNGVHSIKRINESKILR
jgi:hypothetical protein